MLFTKRKHHYGLSLMESLALGYDGTQYYKPNIQKFVDEHPNARIIKVLELCHNCNTAFVSEEVDLSRDLIQIDHKLLLSNQCQTCGHNKLNHELELYRVHPKKAVQKTGTSFFWFIPFSYSYTDLVPDWSKIKPEDCHFTNCEECGCDCFVPRPDDKVWAIYNKVKTGKRFEGDIEYENSLTIMERLWLRKNIKDKSNSE